MPDPVSRLNAALEGRYHIERQLGEGGMATVYLARDLKHNRNVALKVLKPELAAVVGAERFLAEIETTANLQHPHILPLHDSGNADGFLFYVMPYVDGESLRQKLDREHQLPVDEAVQIATNVAEALDYAHRQGVVHRDIKPANILLQDGKPVVSDFGIALAVGVAGAGRLTETGLSLGTPHYMSPEQATGDQSVGRATDIYAIACVLYEMLVGEPPYTGTTAQAILGKIIQGEAVSVTKSRRSVPANVDAAIRKALEKLPADRFTDGREFGAALADPGFRHGESAAAAGARQLGWRNQATAAGIGLVIGAAAMALAATRGRETAPAAEARFTITPPDSAQLNVAGSAPDLAISPDGSKVVYQSGPRVQLNLRAIGEFEGAPIRGTEGAAAPFFSPDGEWIGFVPSAGAGVVEKVSIFGGAPVTLTENQSGFYGASWGADDRIVLGSSQGLSSLAASGGAPELLVSPGEGEVDFRWPSIIEGRDAVLFVINTSSTMEGLQLAVYDAATGLVNRLGLAGTTPRYVSTGHLVYAATDGSLRAVPFDLGSLEVRGGPVPILDGVLVKPGGAVNASLSHNGNLVYTLGVGGAPTSNLVLVSGQGARTVLAELQGVAWFPRFSPDGTRVAFGLSPTYANAGESDLWVVDLSRLAQTRVTFGGDNRYYPLWTRDGTSLTHADGVAQTGNRIVSTAADGTGVADTVLDDGTRAFPTSWSPDERTLAYYIGPTGTTTNSRDLEMLHTDGTPAREPYVETPFMERGAIFSPDGAWVAYVSDKSGQNGVYARPFPGPGAEVTISVGGGEEPVWAPSGDEIYYRHEGDLLAVPLERTGSSLTVGTPRLVFPDPYMRDRGGAAGGAADYDISPNGTDFVMVEDRLVREGSAANDIYVVLNWFEELRERVPLN